MFVSVFLEVWITGEASNPGPADENHWKQDQTQLHFFLWNQGPVSKYTFQSVVDTTPNHGVRLMPEHHLNSYAAGWLSKVKKEKKLNIEVSFASTLDPSGSTLAASYLTLERHTKHILEADRQRIQNFTVHSHVPINVHLVYGFASPHKFDRPADRTRELISVYKQSILSSRFSLFTGDFNLNTNDGIFDEFIEAGWKEVGVHLGQTEPTCRYSTRPDHIWLSPELIGLIGGLSRPFQTSDHTPQVLSLNIPQMLLPTRYWPTVSPLVLTGNVEQDYLEASDSKPPGTAKEVFQILENLSDKAVPVPRHSTTEPCSAVPKQASRKKSRQSEKLINTLPLPIPLYLRSKQGRLLQDLRQQLKNSSFGNTQHVEVWQKIGRSKGYGQSFATWIWRSLGFELPTFPSRALIELLHDHVVQDYEQLVSKSKALERSDRMDALQLDRNHIYKVTKEPGLLPGPVTTHTSIIQITAQADGNVSSEPLLKGSILTKEDNSHVLLEGGTRGLSFSPGLNAEGEYSCTQVAVTQEHQLALRQKPWAGIWNTEKNHTAEQVIAKLGRLPIWNVQPIQHSAENLQRRVDKYDTTSTSCDGVSLDDYKKAPHQAKKHVSSYFEALERSDGVKWSPAELCAFVTTIAKIQGATGSSEFRPILNLSFTYRLWAGLWLSIVLSQLGPQLPDSIFGYLKGIDCHDVFYTQALEIETAISKELDLYGWNIDIKKCFNNLPRALISIMRGMGIPEQLLKPWEIMLEELTC